MAIVYDTPMEHPKLAFRIGSGYVVLDNVKQWAHNGTTGLLRVVFRGEKKIGYVAITDQPEWLLVPVRDRD